MPTFQLELQFDEKGAVNAVRQLGKVADAAGKAQQATEGISKGAKGPKDVGAASQNAAKEIEKANAAAYKFGHTLGSSIREGGDKLRSLTTKILALVGAYKALQGVSSYFSRIFDFSSNLESSQIAIASVIGATNNISDAQGRTLQGVEKFNAAQEISSNLMHEIQILALQTTATFDDLVTGVSGIVAPATKAGVSLEKLPKFAVTAAQAMLAMKIPTQQMRTEIEALLSGNINKVQDILATNLGITGAMVKDWQKQGTLVEELEKRLRIFAEAGEATAQTWTGLKSNLKDAFDYLSSKTGKGVFEGAKQSYRELLDLLTNTKGGKLGVGEDIENITKVIEELQDAIGGELLNLTHELIEQIRELNKPENIAQIKESFKSFVSTAGDLYDNVSDIAGLVWKFMSESISGWSQMPDVIKELGLVGALAFGLKGRVALAGIGVAWNELQKLKGWIEESVGDPEMLANEGVDYNDNGKPPVWTPPTLPSKRTQSPETTKNNGYKITSSIGGFADSGKGASQIASAQEHIKKLREEIDRLNGTSVKAVTSLDQKLREIETVGKKAGMSADAIKQLQGEYQTAFKSNTLKDFNKELLQAQGNTKALRQIKIDDAIKGWEQQFKAAGVSAAEAQPKIEALRAALEKKQEYQDLQTAVSFYDELAQLSGDFTASLEKQNELIALKAEIYRQNGIPPALVAEWELLQKIEKARDPWSGFTRGMRKWSADATNMAQQVETSLTSAFDSASDALADFVMTGKLDFADLANSIISDLARIAARQAIGGIVGGIAGSLGNLFGGGSGGLDSISGGGGWGWLPSAHGNVFSAPGLSAHSNTIVDEPTFFGYDRHFTAFASGAGLMGEAGPEAVMPLSRMSGGDLGVKVMWPDDMMRRVVEMDAWKANVGASQEMMQAIARMNEMRAERAAASPEITVNVYNSTGQQVTQQSRTDQFGNKTLDVYVGDMAAKQAMTPGSRFSKVIATQTGQQVPAIRR